MCVRGSESRVVGVPRVSSGGSGADESDGDSGGAGTTMTDDDACPSVPSPRPSPVARPADDEFVLSRRTGRSRSAMIRTARELLADAFDHEEVARPAPLACLYRLPLAGPLLYRCLSEGTQWAVHNLVRMAIYIYSLYSHVGGDAAGVVLTGSGLHIRRSRRPLLPGTRTALRGLLC